MAQRHLRAHGQQQRPDVLYSIPVDGTDINEQVGRKSRNFTRETAKDALKSRLG
jgi:hypothetical protein